jgi:SPX domain protein involved in polyphosphate accumulation
MIRRFNRFELKYVIPASEQPALVREIRRQMTPDTHGGERGYRVTSLYYDSPDLRCYWSKREGIKFRRKVRIRSYGYATQAPTHPVMVEIKQRIDRTVQKRRVALPLASAYALCDGDPIEESGDELDRDVISEVTLLVRVLALRPACVISYSRQAWLGGPYDPGLRLTFDTQLSCRGPERGLGSGGEACYFLPPDWVVMEIKANDKVPIWVTRLVSTHGLGLTRISKYCQGMARLGGLDRALDHMKMRGGDADVAGTDEAKDRPDGTIDG